MGLQNFLLFMLILICASRTCQAWGLGMFFSPSPSGETGRGSSGQSSSPKGGSRVAQYSTEAYYDPKAMQLLENAKKNELDGSNPCLQRAYENLLNGCSTIFDEDEKRSRFAWQLADCYLKGSGKSLPECGPRADIKSCRHKLNGNEDSVFLAYFMETNTICFQLQTHAFKRQTERLVTELKNTAHLTQDKLETIEEKSDYLLQNSNQIHDSLTSIDVQTQQVALATKNVGDSLGLVLQNTRAVYEQASLIAASQLDLQASQGELRGKIDEGMEMLSDSYSNLGREIDGLRNEAVEIEKEIGRVGDAMSDKMVSLQNTADDIGSVAGESLDKQKQLLDGQRTAMESLQVMTRFMSQALDESRITLQQLADYSRVQKEELIKREEERQEQLQLAHTQLVGNLKSISAAQEVFESKQANMFTALDKLFALHNAMLLESRMVKTFIFYFVLMFGIYMFTSTKQTYTVRLRLYMALCAALIVEVLILWFTTWDFEHQNKWIHCARYVYLVAAALQLLYAIFTFRDYDVLNHNMLLTLMDKMNGMQRNKEFFGDSNEYEDDDDINWCKWVDEDLPEDIGLLEDPNYTPPAAENEYMLPSKNDSGFRYRLRGR